MPWVTKVGHERVFHNRRGNRILRLTGRLEAIGIHVCYRTGLRIRVAGSITPMDNVLRHSVITRIGYVAECQCEWRALSDSRIS